MYDCTKYDFEVTGSIYVYSFAELREDKQMFHGEC